MARLMQYRSLQTIFFPRKWNVTSEGQVRMVFEKTGESFA